MKTIQATLSFHCEVHSLMIHCSDEQWADPHFRTKLKDRLECNPSVLRLRESDEPDWKAEAKRLKEENRSLGKQLSDALKKVATDDSVGPSFAILNSKNG